LKSDDINTLVKYRLEQAQTALDDAKFLYDGKRSSQSIVNRAYYAMFYAALALLQKIGKVPSKHTGVISLFDTEFVLKGIFPKELSKDFHKLFELRQVSDYKTSEDITALQADDTVKKAGVFVESVKKHIASMNKQA
jgi:uncharacterized protein (UPF0332 family)